MKNKLTLACLTLALASTIPAQALDLKSILGKSSSETADSSSTTSVIKNLINDLATSDDFDLSKLVGTWDYSSPAVAFQSESALKKIGGAAASATIEDKLAPYYATAGLTDLTMTVDEDYAFTMPFTHGSLNGTIEKNDEDGSLTFNFSAFKKISIGKVTTYATMTSSTLTLTFDVSQVLTILDKVSSLSGNSALQSVSSLINSYDGLTAGFKLKKE